MSSLSLDNRVAVRYRPASKPTDSQGIAQISNAASDATSDSTSDVVIQAIDGKISWRSRFAQIL